MLAKNLTKLIMILIISAFSFNNASAWVAKKGYTRCVGNTCHRAVVKGGCVNGHCAAVRRGGTWHR